jgi:hypothetical protein
MGVASAAGVSRRRNPLERLYKHILYDFYRAVFFESALIICHGRYPLLRYLLKNRFGITPFSGA